nr:MAG TPA: hypothetical protein [Bacteriophage sp.]
MRKYRPLRNQISLGGVPNSFSHFHMSSDYIFSFTRVSR